MTGTRPAASSLLPQQLRRVWQDVTDGHRTKESAVLEQERLVGERGRRWSDALLEPVGATLEEGLLRELASYVGTSDLAVLRARCRQSLDELRTVWTTSVTPDDPHSVEAYYRQVDGTLYELLWWHTLVADLSPLAYVNALELAERGAGRRYLDFGAGVGSGGLLFARAGFEVTLADVSLPLLAFCRWRFARRDLPARFVDTQASSIPAATFDVITAMDVFEHLVDPAAIATELARALRPGGILVARLHAEEDPDRPQHIATVFDPVLRRLQELGCVQIWADDWLWGHQAFERR